MSNEQREDKLKARHEKIRKDLEECAKGNHESAAPNYSRGWVHCAKCFAPKNPDDKLRARALRS